jgi:TolB-like protein
MGAIRLRHRVPANEADFELLCLELLRAEWNKPGLVRYAHRGEEQSGADIIDLGGKEPLSAAQCKLHAESKTIPPAEIKKEVEKADRFRLKIGKYAILTTAKSSKGTHDAVLEMNRKRGQDGMFLVELMTWETIEELLDKHPSVRDIYYETTERSKVSEIDPKLATAPKAVTSGSDNRDPVGGSYSARAEDGFWVAVLPFRPTANSAGLAALAEELTEGVVAGMSHFSYLRVTAPPATTRNANRQIEARLAAKELGARYAMEGTVRQVGTKVRVVVQPVDVASGVHLPAQSYERAFSRRAVSDFLDDLVPCIVSTVADTRGVLAQAMSESLRDRAAEELKPHEAVVRSFAYFSRLDRGEHALARKALELAVVKAPGQPDVWAWLAIMYREEHSHGFNTLPDPLERAHAAALRAIDFGPSNHWAHLALASVLYYKRDIPAFQSAAAKAIAFNRMDGSGTAYLGSLLAASGMWELGCALMARARSLNPTIPGWYWIPETGRAYHEGDYPGALNCAIEINMPGLWISQVLLAAIHGQLGNLEKAQQALRDLLTLRPEFASEAREEFGKRYQPDFANRLIEGLRKAGLEIADGV